ncbi:heavy metal translocating P-type ATPase [Candidatus Poriferisodalis sp.]|uniref:heavy metal translocating P-type ATPase n=1 Tax=Candidatus Poriferisodalis sp. TaxID=3101277 RepID=UPI003B0146F2
MRVAFGSSAAAAGERTGGTSRIELELPIGGMTCTNCAHRIAQELASQTEVTDASVSFATRRARVVGYEDVPGGLAGRAAAVVSSLGYSVPLQALSPAAPGATSGAVQSKNEAGPAPADAGSSTGGGFGPAWHDWPLTAVLAAGCWLVSMVDTLQFAGWRLAIGAAATVALGWGGRRVLANAWGAARHRSTTMDTLISLGAITAWAWSAAQLASGNSAHLYFDAAAVIVAFVTLGRWLEDRAMARTGDAVQALAELAVPTVRLADGTEIDAADLDVGMQFAVRPGERFAADGVVTEGNSTVDVSMMTGEPVPVDVAPGHEVAGGTLNCNGALVVRATAVGADTALTRITELTRRAQDSRADVGRLADRVSAVFVPLAVSVGLVTFVAWLVIGGLWGDDGATLAAFGDAITAAVAVLVISCPCALGLATPVALAVGVGRAAQLGVLVRGAQVFEDSRHVDAVVFDKTGTVTRGAMSVTDVVAPAWPRDAASGATELLTLGACAESASEHPIGRAIAAAALPQAPESTPELLEAHAVPGVGLTASVRLPAGASKGGDPDAGNGDRGPVVKVRVGKHALFETVPASVSDAVAKAEASGATAVLAGRGPVAEGVIVLTDEIEPSARAAVAALQDGGVAAHLLTGDNERTARAVASSVGITEVAAGVLPQDKVAAIERLQAGGARVAMVGDGINDAAALAAADIGIAAASGADIARSAADITLLNRDLRLVPATLALSRRVLGTIRGNLFWAFAYNMAAIPLAAFGVLDPLVAAGAMAASSLFVVGNSLRLRRFDTGFRQAPDS